MPGGVLPVEGAMQRSFGGGELAPALHARADDIKYATGARTLRNMFVHRSGGVSNRAGTRFVAECKFNGPTVTIFPYQSEITGESLLIEAGQNYFRFFKNGAPVAIAAPAAWSAVVNYVNGDLVLEAGVNYYAKIPSLNQVPPNATFWHPMPAGGLLELPSPFANGVHWSQSGRVITLTHETVTPHELIFEALTRWTLNPIVTTPKVSPPAGLVLTPGGAGALTYGYVVTAAGADYEESIASGQVINAACAVPTQAAPHVLTWTPIAGCPEYYVYADIFNNGTYGFIGTATGAAGLFHDVGFEPDFTITPPLPVAMFATTDNYPRVSASYQQRRFFGYTNTTPDAVHGSRVGYPSNFTVSSPLQDDDALEFRMAANHHHPVRHLVGLKSLIVLTDAGEWSVRGGAENVLTPNSIHADQETYAGAADVPPVVVGNSIIYLQARGSIPRDVRFDIAVEGLAGRDLTIFSSHLFDGRTLRRMDYAQVPHSIVWCVRDDGVLLGMTYLRELEVWGWHRHETLGWFWDVCVVPEADGDAVYFIVRRTIGAATVRYIERLEKREIDPATFDADCFFVDCGLSYAGVAVNNVTGLGHLNGQVVAVVGDGAVIFDGDPTASNAADFTVTAGTLPVVLPASYTNIHVGLRYTADLETLDLDVAGAAVRDKQKAVGPVQVLIDRSSRAFTAGPDSAHLRPYAAPVWEPGADEYTGQVEINTTKTFNKYGRVLIRQSQPLPLTILGVVPNVELGG